VKLESFDAGSKPKVIREVKAMVPNLSLIEVSLQFLLFTIILKDFIYRSCSGQEVCRIFTKNPQGESLQRGC
jgi:hypothetical protein